jgi:hypothetical protein
VRYERPFQNADYATRSLPALKQWRTIDNKSASDLCLKDALHELDGVKLLLDAPRQTECLSDVEGRRRLAMLSTTRRGEKVSYRAPHIRRWPPNQLP